MQVVCSVATNEHHSKQCLFEKAGNYAIRNFYFAENDFIAGGGESCVNWRGDADTVAVVADTLWG
jgi:hypothetical protein